MNISNCHCCILLTLLLIGCSANNEQSIIEIGSLINVDERSFAKERVAEELFSSVSLIKLQSSSKGIGMIGNAKKVQVWKDNIYVFDHTPPKRVLVFTIKTGELIAKVESNDDRVRVSRDASFEDFSIDNNGNIHILDGVNECVYILDANGELLSKQKLPGYYANMQLHPESDNYILFKNQSANNLEDSSKFFNLIELASDTVRGQFFPFRIPEGSFTRISPLNPLSPVFDDKSVRYCSFLSDTIWNIKSGEIDMAYQVSFGQEALPLAWKNMPTPLLIQKLRSRDNVYALGVSEWVENKYALGFQYLHSQQPRFYYNDKSNGKAYVGGFLLSEEYGVPLPFPTFAARNKLYGIMDEIQLERLMTSYRTVAGIDSQIYDDIINHGNTYIVEYSFQ